MSDSVERRFETDTYIQMNMAIIIQKAATEYSLFKSVNCSTCFWWYLHPSPAAHITVSTVSGINETVTAACSQRGWTVPVQPR